MCSVLNVCGKRSRSRMLNVYHKLTYTYYFHARIEEVSIKEISSLIIIIRNAIAK